MATQTILLLGNPKLYEISGPVEHEDLDDVRSVAADLFDTMEAFRRDHGWGRAIAAPQIGVMKRIVRMNVAQERTLINPMLEWVGDEKIMVWDDCMSFPELLVKVQRHRRCRVRFKDLDWNDHILECEDDLSELIQHEVDHLDGVLTVQRAMDDRSIGLRNQRALLM
jgi:peptide deformylase